MHRAYHHGNLREALVEQGVKLIEEKGVNSLTLREIGDRAGVSRTAAYRHFSDKSELLEAIREAAFTEFAKCLETARSEGGSTCFSRLDAMGRAYLKFASEHRAYYEVMFGLGCNMAALDLAESDSGMRAFAVLAGTIMEGQVTGEIRAGDCKLMATLVWAMTHGIATLPLVNSEEAAAWYITGVTDVLRHGLSA